MANKKTIGATIKLDGEKEYKKAISDINSEMKVFSSEMKKTVASFGDNAKSMKSLKEQTSILNAEVDKQREKVATMRGALEDATKKYGENSKQVQQWKVSLNNAEAELSKMEKSLKDMQKQTTGLGKLKTVFSEWKDKLNEVKDKLEPITNGLKKVAGAAAKVASTSFKAFAAGVGAVSAGLVKLGKDAISAYADAEQLKGGVETLFKGASSEVIKNANDAFKTAGMSANEYMENVTSFSASLISSVGGDTVKAAKIADQAIIDMSDNANKMG